MHGPQDDEAEGEKPEGEGETAKWSSRISRSWVKVMNFRSLAKMR
jgi:hypothetical protein